jgi:hypothetical protein
MERCRIADATDVVRGGRLCAISRPIVFGGMKQKSPNPF